MTSEEHPVRVTRESWGFREWYSFLGWVAAIAVLVLHFTIRPSHPFVFTVAAFVAALPFLILAWDVFIADSGVEA